MRSFVVTLTLAIYAAVAGAQQSSVADAYFANQVPISKANLLANIGPDGSRSQGAKAGVVIASPSTSDPDYLYTWTRDASLVYKSLVERLIRGETDLRTKIDQYVDSQAYLQTVSNPSGTISSGGLGEPKFNINLTAFTGSWGRPQRDGPALRATALTQYSNWLIKNGNQSYVSQKVWPVIKLDLDYTAQYWNYTGFDLWEEISSSSFFTTAAQHRALVEGAALATNLGQTASATSYSTQAPNVLCFQQSYWNPSAGYVTSNTGGGRSGKDVNSAIASAHNFDPSAGCDATTFQPCSDKALASLKVYIDSFRSIYPINSGKAANQAVATGRYAEDVYYGGQPWYLATAAVAEQLYDAIIVWKAEKAITVTATSLDFFRPFSSSVVAGTYASDSTTYTTLLNGVQAFADGFIEVIAQYTPADGSLAEQYRRDTGVPTSATHLTWSYASILTAFAARMGNTKRAGARRDCRLPPAVIATQGPPSALRSTVMAETVYGVEPLKNWSPDNALALNPSNYPTWSVTVSVPANTQFSYKYIRKNNWPSYLGERPRPLVHERRVWHRFHERCLEVRGRLPRTYGFYPLFPSNVHIFIFPGPHFEGRVLSVEKQK
ncbi:glucoamylase [Ephemerocybe angulata]|uniref:Glucoamylase n=1 Tax=Ephemerocybe angulata TaxID=980116 RepID=A0A8H6HYW3_9AGAR|nr:glucoamylase [Tulosesus angulatus]